MKEKKAKKPTRKVDEDWETLKKAFSEAGKKAGERFYRDGKNEILYEAD